MKILKNRKKKKGFTLIELIIVIAIIGILALIIIPQVVGYTTKAKNSTAVSDARTLISAIDAYNASQQDSSTQIDISSDANAVSTLANIADPSIEDAVSKIKSADTSLYNANVSDLQNIVSGNTVLHK